VKGRKRHILVDTLGLLIACRVEPADISDRKAAALLLGGLRPLFPNIRTVIADAGHQSRKLARHLLCQDGWKLQIVKRRQRAFKITGLTWIVERSFAWLGRLRAGVVLGGRLNNSIPDLCARRHLSKMQKRCLFIARDYRELHLS
jgi:transposase